MELTDRELLERAAKAAGVAGYFVERTPEDGYPAYTCGITSGRQLVLWNPLTDDGDALRLAVRHKLIITFAGGGNDEHVFVGQRLGPFVQEPLPIKRFDEQASSDEVATRRAIVRAAAAIGEAM